MPDQFVQIPGQEPIKVADAFSKLTPEQQTEIGDFNILSPTQQLQTLSDLGGFSPVAQPVVPGIDEAPVISEGTEDLRGDLTDLTQDVEDAEAGTQDSTATLRSSLEELTSLRDRINTSTQDEIDAIEAAGEAAGAEFESAIAEAEERKRQGLAESTVAAGRRGGFFRTRMAGQAALGPTQGDVGFRGAGGKLEAIESAYDRNIAELKDKQRIAIANAKAASRKAQREGKVDDLNTARDLLKLSRDMQNDIENLEIKKQTLRREERAEERLGRTAAFNIVKEVPEGQSVSIDGITYFGIKKDEVKPFFTGANIVSLMKILPEGTSQQLTDPNTGDVYTIAGLASDDPNFKVLQSTDDRGNVVITKYNIDTGEVISQVSAGQIGKTKTQAANITLTIGEEKKQTLGTVVDTLEGTKNPETGLYNTDDVIKAVQDYAIKFPGKEKEAIAVIKNKVDDTDPRIQKLLTGKILPPDPLDRLFKSKLEELPEE